MKNIHFEGAADRLTVRMDVPEASMTLNATDVTNMMNALANVRATMLPEIPADPPQRQEFQAIASPRFYAMPNHVLGGINLGLRHPGLGWIWFFLPHADAQSLSAYMDKNNAPVREGPASVN